MSKPSTRILFLFACIAFHPSFCLARDHDTQWKRSSVDVADITQSLFNHDHDPFAEEDSWSVLRENQRKAWTDANRIVDLSKGIRHALSAIAQVRRSAIVVPVDIQLVVPDDYLTTEQKASISRYVVAIRAGEYGTSLDFKVTMAPQTLFKRLSMHDPAQHPNDFMAFLEQTATTMGTLNTLFVIINHEDKLVNDYAAGRPFVGAGRVSWMLHNVPKGDRLNIPNLLASAERVAKRVFAPKPLYFPVPLMRQLRVELTAYTPGHDHLALWLRHFAWGEFESSVRSIAVSGQSVSFFSFQANSECQKCEQAFRDVEKYNRDLVGKASLILNNGARPNQTWADVNTAVRGSLNVAHNPFRLFVLDMAMLSKTENTQRLERHPLTTFPGMGIITFRSSDRVAVARLEPQLIRAVLAGVYGIADPDLYMNPGLTKQISTRTKRPSTIVFDVVMRNLIRSAVEQRLSELEEIVDGLLYYDIDPVKALGEAQYAQIAERVNFLLFKLLRAQNALGESRDTATALFMVSSSLHDIRAVRAAFDISEERRPFERLRDPMLRCHFSRLRRQALRASQILESNNSFLKSVLRAGITFSTTVTLTSFLLTRYTSRKARGKQE